MSTDIKDKIANGVLNWIFPVFSNKLTLIVVTAGVSVFFEVPDYFIIFFNWTISVLNKVEGMPIEIPFIKSSVEPGWGIFLIVLGLLYHLAFNFLSIKRYSIEQTPKIRLEQKKYEEQRRKDLELLENFKQALPSGSRVLYLLENHDFHGTFLFQDFDPLRMFLYTWDSAEYQFHNSKVNEKLDDFIQTVSLFFDKQKAAWLKGVGTNKDLMVTFYPESIDPEFDPIPPRVETAIQETNGIASELYKKHQDLISFASNEI